MDVTGLTINVSFCNLDQPGFGRVVRGGRQSPAELPERVLRAQSRLFHLRVQGQLLRSGRPRRPQRVRAMPGRPSMRGRGEAAVSPAHVPGSDGAVHVQTVLVHRDRRRDLFGVSQQAPAAVVYGGVGRADVRAVLAVQADLREGSRRRAGELLPELLSDLPPQPGRGGRRLGRREHHLAEEARERLEEVAPRLEEGLDGGGRPVDGNEVGEV